MSEVVEIHIEQHSVESGDRIAGSVRFPHPPSDKLSKVKAVKLSVHARIHGSGSEETFVAHSRVLAEGPQTGAPIPFEVKIPEDAPITWDGRHVKVSWVASVELDIPWALDPRDAASFKVVPKKAR